MKRLALILLALATGCATYRNQSDFDTSVGKEMESLPWLTEGDWLDAKLGRCSGNPDCLEKVRTQAFAKINFQFEQYIDMASALNAFNANQDEWVQVTYKRVIKQFPGGYDLYVNGKTPHARARFVELQVLTYEDIVRTLYFENKRFALKARSDREVSAYNQRQISGLRQLSEQWHRDSVQRDLNDLKRSHR